MYFLREKGTQKLEDVHQLLQHKKKKPNFFQPCPQYLSDSKGCNSWPLFAINKMKCGLTSKETNEPEQKKRYVTSLEAKPLQHTRDMHTSHILIIKMTYNGTES